jgi:hypothetical protein
MHGFEHWDGTKRWLFTLTNRSASAAALQDFVVIETGRENHENQFDRLRFETRSTPASLVATLRDFTFNVAPPRRSIHPSWQNAAGWLRCFAQEAE